MKKSHDIYTSPKLVALRIVFAVVILAISATAVFSDFTDTPELVFIEPTPTANSTFGDGVAAAGNEVLISATGDFATIDGVAYLFDTQSGVLLQTYTNPSAYIDNCFGCALAMAGDYIFVSAPEDSSSSSYAGAVYQFNRTAGGAPIRTYNSENPAEWNEFGWALAVSGQLLFIGESGADPLGVSNAGAVHVFNMETGLFVRTLKKLSATGGENFGAAIAIAGNSVAVGAPHDGDEETQGGAIYVFDVATGTHQITIRKAVSHSFDRFGSSVAAVGSRILVGSPLDWDEGTDTRPGAAFLFDGDAASPTFGELITAIPNPTPAHLDRFGQEVAGVADLAIVSALWDDTVATNAGAVYAFGESPTPLQTFYKPDTVVGGDWFGWSLANAGGSLLIGALYDDPAGVFDAGAAYLFGNTPTGPDVDATVTSDDGTAITLTFDDVTQAGVTTAEQVECPMIPDGSTFELCDPPVCHDISTTATFTPTAEGGIQLCINYAATGCPDAVPEEANIRLLHDKDLDGTLDDITDNGYPDTANNLVCGTTTHLSLFEVALELVPQYECLGFEAPMNNGTVTVRGNRALPHKANLLDETGAELSGIDLLAAPVVQVLFHSGSGGEPVDVSGDALPVGHGTDGNEFVYTDSGKWQFNLKTKNYSAPGTYYMTMTSGDDSEYLIAPECESSFEVRR